MTPWIIGLGITVLGLAWCIGLLFSRVDELTVRLARMEEINDRRS